jgi:hypothetical protein
VGENNGKTAFVKEFEVYLSFKIKLKFTFLKHNDYLRNFLGYAAIKVIETRLFNSEIKYVYI